MEADGAGPQGEALPRFEADGPRRSCVLGGRPVRALRVQPDGLAIEVHAPEGGLELRVASPFLLEEEGGAGALALTHARPRELGPLLGRVASEVDRVAFDPAAGLEVRFGDGARLVVPPAAGLRAWAVQGSGDLEAIEPFLRGG